MECTREPNQGARVGNGWDRAVVEGEAGLGCLELRAGLDGREQLLGEGHELLLGGAGSRCRPPVKPAAARFGSRPWPLSH